MILIPARIKELYPTEDYCNVSAESIFGRRPDDAREAINTGVMLRANPGDENDLSEFAVASEADVGEASAA